MAEDLEKPQTEQAPVANRVVDAPAIFSDGIHVANAANGVVRMSFLAYLADPSDAPDGGWKTVNVATLVMPEPGFLAMLTYLNESVDRLTSKA